MTTAAHYTPGRIKEIRLICLHTMESQEKPGTAVSVAAWFSNKSRAPEASAHMCVDGSQANVKPGQKYPAPIVRVVDDGDTAWAAPGVNADGLHIEMAGTAAQSSANWADPYSLAVLENAATVAAMWCRKYEIPVIHLSLEQVQDGKSKGIIGHIDATHAFPDLAKQYGAHTDPGVNFPWTYFLQLVNKKLAL